MWENKELIEYLKRMDKYIENIKNESPLESLKFLHKAGIISKDEFENLIKENKNGK
jgi:uncharacterized protein YutE (UPF0331/DUF86 family)